jgi:hypothetical protein
MTRQLFSLLILLAAMKDVLAAYFAGVNDKGGIYNRRIELQTIDAANLKTQVENGELFALVGGLSAGADKELDAVMRDDEIPLIGPTSLVHSPSACRRSLPKSCASSTKDSSRSERQHKAWGGARLCERNPRITNRNIGRARETGDSVVHLALSAASRAQSCFSIQILGLAPQALCCRSLRELS